MKGALRASTGHAWLAFAATTGLVLASPAYAQDDQEDAESIAETETTADTANTIVVTGSRIARSAAIDGTIPITVVSSEDIMDTGQISVGDQLNQLPQLRSTFSQANSTRFIGTAGMNFLDLRGLGTERTLVLVNGRRHVSTSPGTFRWDVNNVPADLVDRVDVVTGGNSAIYGSDAIAGVVNFVLRREYDGIQLRGQMGISDEGDSASHFVSGIIGKNFGDGRGNITFAAEYAKQDALFILEREQGRDRRQFQLVQNLGAQLNPANGPIRTTGEPATGDGIPDTAFIGGLQRVSTSVGGTFTAVCPTAAATGESATAFAARRAISCSGISNPGSTNALSQFGNAFAFLPDGTLTANGCVTDFRGFGSGNCIGGLGSTLRESGMFQPELERINATMLANFEVSSAFEAFLEAQYTHIDALQESSPTFGAQTFSINNPFLTTQARNLIRSLSSPTATTFSMDRQNLDFGVRGEDHERETFRGVIGFRGDLSDNLRYEISGSYGRFESFYATSGNYIRTRFANAINAVLAPATYSGPFALNAAGQRVACSINVDANAANDDPACIPVNLFGAGQVSEESLNYFGYTSTRDQTNEQYILSGFISGDTGAFLNLPGGPVGFAVGGEYRVEDQYGAYDDATAQGLTFLNLLPEFNPPKYKIKEAFAELRLPILAGMPFAEELTVEGAARVSDYNLGTTGTVVAYNGGLIYSPVRDIRLRASYQRSVRAPSLGDLYSSPTQTFMNNFADPCGQQNINNNPFRVANCAAAGVPTTQTFTTGGVTTTEPFTNRPSSGIGAANRGNPELQEETGTSFTLGVVFQPSMLPGLTLSVDYYDIEIKDAINTLAPATVVNQCYDSSSGIDNPFCAVITRLPNGTLAGQNNVFHNGNVVVLNNPGFASLGQPFNYAKTDTKGIDADLSYRHDFGEDSNLTFRGIASYLIARDTYTDVTDPTFRNRLKSEVGDPEWRFQLSTKLKLGDISIGHQLQYIGKQIVNCCQYETFFGIDGRAPLDPDATPFPYYPERWYHDVRFEFDATEDFKFYMGVDNVTDTLPPYDMLGTEAGSLYDPTGRFFYAGVRAKFQ
ncbi:TonB-dependent receptor [Altererythrobacter arenosus]|uniref:TonB-dependent receptor n=1 Tax=Altererythrobacter arenosus TaxID=3032592 RepID=A0ABY8FXJ3_9SPHN|nr:TonB-dependent receptor [Altererythrobacter sp. CAU 1644]WFL78955.1 TonB-dependent receptor [Altererythrobacter sp. CAU 1644]